MAMTDPKALCDNIENILMRVFRDFPKGIKPQECMLWSTIGSLNEIRQLLKKQANELGDKNVLNRG